MVKKKTLTWNDLVTAVPALKNLNTARFVDIDLTIRVVDVVDVMDQKMRKFEAIRGKITEKYSPVDGEDDAAKKSRIISIREEVEDLLTKTVSLAVSSFKCQELKEANLSAEELRALLDVGIAKRK